MRREDRSAADGRPVSTGTCDLPGAGTCDLPNCHATRLAGSGRRYCCDAHTTIGRSLANERSRAVALERQALRDALDGKTRPPGHVGFLATTSGVVLTGQALLELRAAAGVLRSAAARLTANAPTGSTDRSSSDDSVRSGSPPNAQPQPSRRCCPQPSQPLSAP